MNREEFQQRLKAIVVQRAQEIVANREEMRGQADDAAALFKALRDAPTWSILHTPKPKGFKPPKEGWSQPVSIVKKGSPDDDA